MHALEQEGRGQAQRERIAYLVQHHQRQERAGAAHAEVAAQRGVERFKAHPAGDLQAQHHCCGNLGNDEHQPHPAVAAVRVQPQQHQQVMRQPGTHAHADHQRQKTPQLTTGLGHRRLEAFRQLRHQQQRQRADGNRQPGHDPVNLRPALPLLGPDQGDAARQHHRQAITQHGQ
ncbi:hypothetical protein D3C71_1374270 [compost metagenome]